MGSSLLVRGSLQFRGFVGAQRPGLLAARRLQATARKAALQATDSRTLPPLQ